MAGNVQSVLRIYLLESVPRAIGVSGGLWT